MAVCKEEGLEQGQDALKHLTRPTRPLLAACPPEATHLPQLAHSTVKLLGVGSHGARHVSTRQISMQLPQHLLRASSSILQQALPRLLQGLRGRGGRGVVGG